MFGGTSMAMAAIHGHGSHGSHVTLRRRVLRLLDTPLLVVVEAQQGGGGLHLGPGVMEEIYMIYIWYLNGTLMVL